MVIYEWLYSLEDEIDLIWCGRGRLSVVSTLYILSRYAWILDSAVWLSTINPVSYTVSGFKFVFDRTEGLRVGQR